MDGNDEAELKSRGTRWAAPHNRGQAWCRDDSSEPPEPRVVPTRAHGRHVLIISNQPAGKRQCVQENRMIFVKKGTKYPFMPVATLMHESDVNRLTPSIEERLPFVEKKFLVVVHVCHARSALFNSRARKSAGWRARTADFRLRLSRTRALKFHIHAPCEHICIFLFPRARKRNLDEWSFKVHHVAREAAIPHNHQANDQRMVCGLGRRNSRHHHSRQIFR